jgi:hypothetical protein
MSTIKANKLEHISTSNGGIQLDNAGHVTVDGVQMPTTGALGSRRINLNGAMQVAQRDTSVTGLSSSNTCQTVDRMFIRINGAGTFTISQSTEAPDGFSNSIKWDCTTANSSLGAGNFAYMAYRFEGQDLQHLKKGTSGAEKVTVSFWVRAAQTGTYAFRLMDIDNDRSIGQSYTISTADTWEHKTLTFDGDTTGAFGNDNGLSCQLVWWLAAGTNFTSGAVPTAWEAKVTADEAAGLNVNLASSTDNDFYLTGLQFEVGEMATPFEHRSYGAELQLCERYLQQWQGDGTSSTQNVIAGAGCINSQSSACFLVPSPKMRGPFSVEFADLIISDSATYDEDVTAINLTNASSDGAYVTASHAAQGTRGDAQSLRVKSGQNGYLRMISEL